jgi:hypothetical protein
MIVSSRAEFVHMGIQILDVLVVRNFPIISSTSEVEAALVTTNGGSESLFGDRTSKSMIILRYFSFLST